MTRTIFAMAAAIVLAGCTPEGPAASSATAPQPVAAQRANVPEQYAAFAGRWTGLWDGSYPSVLIVESITPTGQLTLSYQYLQEAPVRIRSRIENNGFRWGTANRFAFTLRPNGVLEGERVTPAGLLNTIILTRD